jgi:hypothetical protein
VRYYCSRTETSGKSEGPEYEAILRGLCYRLAWESHGAISKHATEIYDEYSKPGIDAELSVEETWEPLFKKLVESSSTPIVIVIDALDECRSQLDYTTMLQSLSDLPRAPAGPYYLVSSRPHVRVEKYFDGAVQMFDVVQPQTEEDMKRFIKDQIDMKENEVHFKETIFCKLHSFIMSMIRTDWDATLMTLS